VADSASAGAGGLTIHCEMLGVETDQRVELVDVTDRVSAVVHASGVREGIVNLWSMHTTCAVFMNENQHALLTDIRRLLEQVVARDAEWMHNDPEHSDCDRMNADSHLRAMLLGHSLTLQVSGGELVLGQCQRVIVGELDGPRARSLRVQVWGLG
jgi:secondary thiamine-phosphate synthase enzyme